MKPKLNSSNDPPRPASGRSASPASNPEAVGGVEAERSGKAGAIPVAAGLGAELRMEETRNPGSSPSDILNAAGEPDVSGLSDEDLMKLCQDGDEFAFEALFQRYEGPALSFIQRLIGDRNRTEALGQEAFLRIFKDAKSYQYPRSFTTWFYTIVRNLCKNELRWRSRHPTISIEESVGAAKGNADSDSAHIGDNLRSETTDPLDKMVDEELNVKLEESLATLPELERDILILKCFQGLKYREIAEVVGVPVGTVRSRIHAALERLRKSVKEYL